MASNTKLLVIDNFIKISKNKSIDKITVRELIEYCHISRHTFYYYFQDIQDVIECYIQQKLQHVLNECLSVKSLDASIEILILSVTNEKYFLSCLVKSQRIYQIEQVFNFTTKAFLREVIETQQLFDDKKHSDMEFVLDFYSFAITGVLLQILYKEPKDINKICSQISCILKKAI